MSQRSCPSCGSAVAAHQTLCPRCRTAVPSDPGPVAASAEGSTIRVSAPPPRTRPTAPPPEGPAALRDTPAPLLAPPPSATGPVPPPPDRTLVTDDPTRHDVAVPVADPPRPTASAGTLGVPGAPSLDDRGNLPGGLAAVVGAVMVAVGVALPWLDVAGETVSGWSASEDAKVLAALAGLALVAGALVVGGARSLVLRVLLALAGVVVLAVGVVDLLSVAGIDDLDPSPGIGLHLVLAGGVVVLVAAGLTRHRRFR